MARPRRRAAPRPKNTALRRFLTDCSQELSRRQSLALDRRLFTVEAIHGSTVSIGGRVCVNWCSNDYLGLSQHPRLAAAASAAASAYGVGARASRLLSGTTRLHTQLEEALAGWFGAEAALVFASGYLANLGALQTLLGSGDLVAVDRLAHASLIDAARATSAALRVFRHNDLPQLERLLRRSASFRRRLIVTEGVFSMDGDRAPLKALVALAEKYDAIVYLDDAHGAFVLGDTGRGSPEIAGIGFDRLLYMATLGKAAGCQGGFVAGPRAWITHLANQARTFIYATALAAPVAAAAIEALRVMRDEPQRRADVELLSLHLAAALRKAKRAVPKMPSHIIPVMVGESEDALALSQKLREQGLWCPAIRPPTVPDGTARLRLSLTASHTQEQADQLVDALAKAQI